MPVAGKGEYSIQRAEQLRALESTVCQEIVDLVGGGGPCSVRQMAGLMGRRPDSLYYHVRKLLRVGLLIRQGTRGSGRRTEAVFDVPGRPLRLAYDPANADNVRAVKRVVASMLRSALRDFGSGFRPELAVVEGEQRNLWAARLKGWVSESELAELNSLLARILEIFHADAELDHEEDRPPVGARDACPRRLHSMTWVLAPEEPVAMRRRKPASSPVS